MKAADEIDPWETGELGRNAQHVRVASAETEAVVDEETALQLISLRMPQEVLRQLKLMAEYRGSGLPADDTRHPVPLGRARNCDNRRANARSRNH